MNFDQIPPVTTLSQSTDRGIGKNGFVIQLTQSDYEAALAVSDRLALCSNGKFAVGEFTAKEYVRDPETGDRTPQAVEVPGIWVKDALTPEESDVFVFELLPELEPGSAHNLTRVLAQIKRKAR